jgi:hypothetical protein
MTMTAQVYRITQPSATPCYLVERTILSVLRLVLHQSQSGVRSVPVAVGLRKFAAHDTLRRVVVSASVMPAHRNINVFKNLPRCNANDAFGRFNQVVALSSNMLAAQAINKAQAGSESLGLHQKAGAIGFPFFRFHVALTGPPSPALAEKTSPSVGKVCAATFFR